MTAKEQLLREALGWSEHDAEVALRAVQCEHAGGSADEWGDISKVHDWAFGATIQGPRRGGECGGARPVVVVICEKVPYCEATQPLGFRQQVA